MRLYTIQIDPYDTTCISGKAFANPISDCIPLLKA